MTLTNGLLSSSRKPIVRRRTKNHSNFFRNSATIYSVHRTTMTGNKWINHFSPWTCPAAIQRLRRTRRSTRFLFRDYPWNFDARGVAKSEVGLYNDERESWMNLFGKSDSSGNDAEPKNEFTIEVVTEKSEQAINILGSHWIVPPEVIPSYQEKIYELRNAIDKSDED